MIVNSEEKENFGLNAPVPAPAEETPTAAVTASPDPVPVPTVLKVEPRLTKHSVSRGSIAKADETSLATTRKLINTAIHAVSMQDLVETIRVGNHVVATYFDDDFDAAVNRNGHKGLSLRKLCGLIAEKDCPVGRSWVTDAVHLAAQQHMLPAAEVEGFGKGLMQALLVLKSTEDKQRWAKTVREEGLGANELKRRIREELHATTNKGPAQMPIGFRSLSNVLDGIGSKLKKLASDDAGGELDLGQDAPARAEELLTKVKGLWVSLKKLSGKLANVTGKSKK